MMAIEIGLVPSSLAIHQHINNNGDLGHQVAMSEEDEDENLVATINYNEDIDTDIYIICEDDFNTSDVFDTPEVESEKTNLKQMPYNSNFWHTSSKSQTIPNQTIGDNGIGNSSSNDDEDVWLTKGEEEELIKAAGDSLCDGNCLPLIKQELKIKIQMKRLEKGEEEITTDETNSQEELFMKKIRKRSRAKELNRLASFRSREKKAKKENEIVERFRRLSESNEKLQVEKKNLESLKEYYTDKLENCQDSNYCMIETLVSTFLI
ncbi:hypothetical protein SNE40_018915 [Patella caerulea]|uniref:BZIP domain-containing protein n=1 Tax=Patella caerulea TaxID=87958 RepID=A0AAN8J6W7_PATCE